MHAVNHLYMVFKHVIGHWFALVNAPGLGIRVVLSSANHSGYGCSPLTMFSNDLTTSVCGL